MSVSVFSDAFKGHTDPTKEPLLQGMEATVVRSYTFDDKPLVCVNQFVSKLEPAQQTGKLFREGGVIYRNTNKAALGNTPILVREVAVQGVPSLSDGTFDEIRECFCLHLDAIQAKAAITKMPTEVERIAINAERERLNKEASALASIKEDLAAERKQCQGVNNGDELMIKEKELCERKTQFALAKESFMAELNDFKIRHEQYEKLLQIQRLISAKELELMDQITKAQRANNSPKVLMPCAAAASSSSSPQSVLTSAVSIPPSSAFQQKDLASCKFVQLPASDMREMAWCAFQSKQLLEQQKRLQALGDACNSRIPQFKFQQQQLVDMEEQLNRDAAFIHTQADQLTKERFELIQSIRARENVNASNQTVIEAHILKGLLFKIKDKTVQSALETYQKETAEWKKRLAEHMTQRESFIAAKSALSNDISEWKRRQEAIDAKIKAITDSLAHAKNIDLPGGGKGILVIDPDFLGCCNRSSILFVPYGCRLASCLYTLPGTSRTISAQIRVVGLYDSDAESMNFTKERIRELFQRSTAQESSSCPCVIQ